MSRNRWHTDQVRLFIAVTPPESALQDLAAVVRRHTGMAGAPRWTPAERWHVTLAFLGDVDESTKDRLRRGLTEVTAAPLRLRIAGAGTFPERKAPRVLWVGLAGDVPELSSLAKHVRIVARRSRITLDRKPFQPHLTLGRWRPGDVADRAVAEELAEYRGPEFVVPSFALMRSHLGPKPRYESLQEWPLTA